MAEESGTSNPRRLSQIFDPLSRLSELTRESRSTPSSPRLLPRRPRESNSSTLPTYDSPDRGAGSEILLGHNGINWQERCFELQLELQRSRAQATRTRDMLREKVSVNIYYETIYIPCLLQPDDKRANSFADVFLRIFFSRGAVQASRCHCTRRRYWTIHHFYHRLAYFQK